MRKREEVTGMMKTPLISLRPSNADRAWLCPASLHPAEDEPLIEVVGEGGPANIGSAAHEAMACIVEDKPFDLDVICAKYHVEKDEVSFLVWAADKYAKMIREQFDVEAWTAEKPMSCHTPFRMSGTADMIGLTLDRKTVINADLKTGRADTSYEHQMRAYAYMALNEYKTAESVVSLILWARDLEVQKWEWTREDLENWIAKMQTRVWDWDGVNYAVGSHCTYCRRHASCEARIAEMKSVQALMALHKDPPPVLVGDDLRRAWRATIDIPKLFEAWRDRQKERVIATGSIDLGDGTELAVVERNSAPLIDTEKAVKVLQAGFKFSDSDFFAVCDVKIGGVKDQVAKNAARGEKGKARKEVVEALTKEGALEPRTNMVLTPRKKEG